MDTNGKLMKIYKNEKGIALVWLAVIIVVFLAFVGLAVDIGYMYVAKGQLQNASDAGALAGIPHLRPVPNPPGPSQSLARSDAVAFAGKNHAAGSYVQISSDNSNTMSPGNDVTLGHWNGTSYADGVTPFNAIRVRARRTADAPGSQVDTFFAKILGMAPGAASWEKMSASADAVAALPVRASNFIALCVDSCTGHMLSDIPNNDLNLVPVLDPVRKYDRDPGISSSESFAWTSLLSHVSSVNEIGPLICNDLPNEEVCGKKIWTTQGEAASLFKDMEASFNDPTFDPQLKEISGNTVTGWWLLVPVTLQCKPTQQPQAFDVWGYAWVHVTSVCDTGGGIGSLCRPYSTPHCEDPKKIVIDKIACISCADPSIGIGARAVLVK